MEHPESISHSDMWENGWELWEAWLAQCSLRSLCEDLIVTCAWCGCLASLFVVVVVLSSEVVVVLFACVWLMGFFLKVALNFFQRSSFSSGVAFLQSIRRCGPAHFKHFSGLRKCLVLWALAYLPFLLEYLLCFQVVSCWWFCDECRCLPRVFSC